MSAQRGSTAVEAAHRSILPNIAGAPWWTALLFAVTTTAIGYGIDAASGHKQLTSVFACLYIAGCVAAVLAVRQDGLFTAIIQPPLILFCTVPGAYWMFHGGQLGSLKDLLINCGYPLIERFPLMLGTAGGILLLGLIRWYLGNSHRTAADDVPDEATDSATAGAKSFFLSSVGAKLNSLLGVGSNEDDADEASSADAKRARAARTSQRRAAATGQGARDGRSGTRSARNGSRHARPPLDDEHDPAAEPRRRRRPAPPRDFDPDEPPRRPRRRPRPEDGSDPRGQSPREGRREPYERSAPRGGRYDGYDRYESSGGARRFAPYESFDSYEPPAEQRRRRPPPNGTNGTGPTHHPISQVRYRGGSGPDEERRSRPRAHGRSQSPSRADSWEYDA